MTCVLIVHFLGALLSSVSFCSHVAGVLCWSLGLNKSSLAGKCGGTYDKSHTVLATYIINACLQDALQ